MPLCTVDDVPGMTFQASYWGRYGLGLALAAFVAAASSRRGTRALWIGAGVGLMSVPAWTALLGTAPDILRTFCAQGDLNAVIVPGQVVPASPRFQLSGQYIASILQHVGHVGAGALLLWRGLDPVGWRSPTTRRIASALSPFVPMGQGRWRGEARSLGLGVALFPLLVLANVLLLALIPKTGDDSRVFQEIAPLQVVMLALAAGIGEELTYRLVMQQGLRRAFGGGRVALAVAILVQAIIFAYAHTGYKDLQHLQFAFYFALLAALATEALGIWAAIALHVLIDIAAFATSARPTPALLAIETAVGLLVLAGTAWTIRQALRDRRSPPNPL